MLVLKKKLKIKKYNFDVFSSEKHFKKYLPHSQTDTNSFFSM
jgi:hypothetical protein